MGSLDQHRILVVEDEFILARGLSRALEELDAIVLGPDSSIKTALDRVEREHRIDVAVLDVNLNGEFSFPVADALIARRIPFIFVTGYDEAVTRDRYPDVPKCNKPYVIGSLLTMIQAALSRQ
ncbi:response regulator [Sphingomonas sp. Ag1]|jgi:CheY-like chemotaxis protein|uniref:response regulator n=1 Tax=Sphingomonas sp. Ag1 TaxID=1642949 RepID=UPI0006224E9C|nr:response regulator [Sphingomonas sp. Ag1]KKI20377.1 hypothetical protein XM50_05825 [Sphingomonas sp. Ag1]